MGLQRRPAPSLPSMARSARRLLPAVPPHPEDFTSPVHQTGVVARVGLWLGIAIGLCFVTGLISHNAQKPAGLALGPFPSWGYRVSQGIHVASGIAAIPLLLAKLFAVYPRLFLRPLLPRPNRAGLLLVAERGSIAVLVGAALFELSTGLLNINQWYVFGFGFVPVHYALAWIMAGALVVHIAVKLPIIRSALAGTPKAQPIASASPEAAPAASSGAAPAASAETAPAESLDPVPTESSEESPPGSEQSSLAGSTRFDAASPDRRGFLIGAVGVSGVLTALTVGQSLTPLSPLAVLAPRRPGEHTVQGVPINKTADGAGLGAQLGDPTWGEQRWRLTLIGPGYSGALSLADLQEFDQVTVKLPITCVEGWSVGAHWTGVRVRDLVARAGGASGQPVQVTSMEKGSPYSTSLLQGSFAGHPDTILALQINGETLLPDHGYPARIMAPNRPGVLQTKWVERIEVVT